MTRRLLLCLQIALFTALGFGVWTWLDQPVRRFVVQGDLSRLEQHSVEHRLAAMRLDGILSTPLDALVSDIEALRWAREVSARRVWPDTIELSLSREAPVARWREGLFVSAAGELLALPDAHEGLPAFEVALSEPRQAMEIYRLLEQIAGGAGLHIERLVQNAQGEWSLVLDQGLEVRLGAQELTGRMQRFVAVVERELIVSGREAAYVDVRYPNGVAVRYRTGEELSEMVAGQSNERGQAHGV